MLSDDWICRYISSSILMWFRKGFNTQHALLRLMDTFKESLDEKEVAGTSLMDLSKAFDCIEHELLIP